METIDLIQVAQKMLDELRDSSIRSTYMAEGVRMFIGRLRELEEGAAVATAELPAPAEAVPVSTGEEPASE